MSLAPSTSSFLRTMTPASPIPERPYTGPSYANLPTEIITHIMEYLPASDLLVASLACVRWFDASQHPHFSAHHALDFTGSAFDEQDAPVRTFVDASLRNYSAVLLRQVDFRSNCDAFWQRFSASMQSVAFRHCDLRERTLKTMLLNTDRLRRLEIEDCRELFMSGRLFESDTQQVMAACAAIQHLGLINNRYLSDALFQRFVSMMPALQSLDLSKCQISFHQGLYRKFYAANVPADKASESVLTFQFIGQYLTGPAAASLTSLALNETLVDAAALETIGQCQALRLQRLELRACDQLTNASIVQLVAAQPQLRELDVSRLGRLTDAGLLAICSELRDLRVLRVGRCRSITDAGVRHVADLHELRVLDISDCDELTSEAVLNGVALHRSDRMRELNLSALRICPLAVMRVAEQFPELRTLNLSRCKNGVTDLAVQWICRYSLCLRELRLDYCDKISDVSLTGAGMDRQIRKFEAQQMRSAPAGAAEAAGEAAAPSESSEEADDEDDDAPIDPFNRNPFKISLRSKAEEDIVNDAKRNKRMLARFGGALAERDQQLEADAEAANAEVAPAANTYSINRLRALRILSLAGCSRITDVWLRFSCQLPDLRHLSLAYCQQVTSWGIEQLVRRCATLESLDLSECQNINDRAIELISIHLRRLTHLKLERCTLLTDHTLDYLTVNCERLRHLDVRGCRAMCAEPSLRVEGLRSLRHCDQSKPGPYVDWPAAGSPLEGLWATAAAVAFKFHRVPPSVPAAPAMPLPRPGRFPGMPRW